MQQRWEGRDKNSKNVKNTKHDKVSDQDDDEMIMHTHQGNYDDEKKRDEKISGYSSTEHTSHAFADDENVKEIRVSEYDDDNEKNAHTRHELTSERQQRTSSKRSRTQRRHANVKGWDEDMMVAQ